VKIVPQNEDGAVNFLFSSNDNMMKYYDKAKSKVTIFEGHSDFIMNIEIKNKFISTSSKDNTVRIWEWWYSHEGSFVCKCICLLRGHSESVNCSCLMVKKGYKVATVGKDKCVKLWDFSNAIKSKEDATGDHEIVCISESQFSEIGHEEEINVVKASPNEKLIASGSYDKTIKVLLIHNII
jgi:U3 small nucleolar RNA-associated protein 13